MCIVYILGKSLGSAHENVCSFNCQLKITRGILKQSASNNNILILIIILIFNSFLFIQKYYLF